MSQETIQLNASIDEIRKCSVFFAVPSIDGKIEIRTMNSFISCLGVLNQIGVKTRIFFNQHDSLITRSRNMCATQFLEDPDFQQYTHLMFIDSDIEFPKESIVQLLSHKKDIIGASYPKKALHFDKIIKAHKSGVADEHLQKYGTNTVCQLRDLKESNLTIKSNEIYPCDYLGTGFMMIKREVFHEIIKQKNMKKVKSGLNGTKDDMYLFFDTSVNHHNLYLSEDYDFNEKAIQCGIQPYVVPYIQLAHVGKYVYQGDLIRSWGGIYQHEKNQITTDFIDIESSLPDLSKGTKLE